MPRKRLTGLGGGNAIVQGSLQWDYVQSNKDLARRIVIFLEGRRLLTRVHRDGEDEEEVRESANTIRHWLTMERMNVKGGGDLDAAIVRMGKVFEVFVSAAGRHSINFNNDSGLYWACLQALRDNVGEELGWLAQDYDLTLAPELEAIVPPADPRPFVQPSDRRPLTT